MHRPNLKKFNFSDFTVNGDAGATANKVNKLIARIEMLEAELDEVNRRLDAPLVIRSIDESL